MRIIVLCLLAFLAGAAQPQGGEKKPIEPKRYDGDQLWILVAKSTWIVEGKLNAPVSAIKESVRSNKPRYVVLKTEKPAFLKGQGPLKIPVMYYTRSYSGFRAEPERVIQFNGQRVLTFVSFTESPYNDPKCWLEGISAAEEQLAATVKNELAKQAGILARFVELTETLKKDPLYVQVKTLVDATVNAETQKEAFKKLEALGEKGVPFMILHMDDARPLPPRTTLSFRNPPGHWEGMRHYGPKTVAQALEYLLNHITGYSFAGDPDGYSFAKARQEAVNGWRIFLYYASIEKRDVPGYPVKPALKPLDTTSEHW